MRFAVKCKNSTQRPVFKRRCSGCPPGHVRDIGHFKDPGHHKDCHHHKDHIGHPLASSPGLYVPESGHCDFNDCCNHRPYSRDLPLPILSSSSALGKSCLHHPQHSPNHTTIAQSNHLPSSFNYTECHTPPVSNLVYLNRSKSVGSRPGEGTRFGYSDPRDYALENETCIN